MLSETISGTVEMLARALAWRDIPEDRRDDRDPLSMWDGLSPNGREMYLGSARRLRSALLDVEEAWDPYVDEALSN